MVEGEKSVLSDDILSPAKNTRQKEGKGEDKKHSKVEEDEIMKKNFLRDSFGSLEKVTDKSGEENMLNKGETRKDQLGQAGSLTKRKRVSVSGNKFLKQINEGKTGIDL